MELKEAIYERRSIRGYTSQPVDQDVIREILRDAGHAISGVNSQPWEFVVATGKELDELKAANMESLNTHAPEDREDAAVPEGIYVDRMRNVGKALLGAMDIKREDKVGRKWWGERGYRFFDAPVVIFLMMDDAFDETAYRFDMGCVAQNLCLAAVEHGLGTCVEDQAVTYQAAARKILGIPENKRFVIGIALGYPDDDFAANHVVTERVDVDEITTWKGF